jgi:hypothetical protein
MDFFLRDHFRPLCNSFKASEYEPDQPANGSYQNTCAIVATQQVYNGGRRNIELASSQWIQNRNLLSAKRIGPNQSISVGLISDEKTLSRPSNSSFFALAPHALGLSS